MKNTVSTSGSSENEINQQNNDHKTVSTPVSQVAIQGIYTKNHQFSVHILRTNITPPSAWSPIVDIQANPRFTDLGAGQYEVIVSLRVTLKKNDQLIAEIQLEQAGLFTLKEIPETQRHQVLYGICPNSLFPYASVWVNQTLAQAGFPPVFLAPLDFIALYRQYQQQQAVQEQKPINTDAVATVQ